MDVVDKIKSGEPVRDPDRMIKVQVAADIKMTTRERAQAPAFTSSAHRFPQKKAQGQL